MVAAPQYAQIQFRGISGQTYNKDLYLSDANAALARHDGGGGASATSPDHWIAPEPVLLQDFAIVTGMTDTTKMQVIRNSVPTGDVLRYSLHLNTLNNRPKLTIAFRRGDKISFIQMT